jgi:hypothetical protein
MVARAKVASRGKCKKPEKPILVGDSEESQSLLCVTVHIREFPRAAGFCQI